MSNSGRSTLVWLIYFVVLALSTATTSSFGSKPKKKAAQEMLNTLSHEEVDETAECGEVLNEDHSVQVKKITWPMSYLGHDLGLSHQIDQNLDTAICAICHSDLKDLSPISRLPCHHYYCKNCLGNISDNEGCPECRTSFNKSITADFKDIYEAQESSPISCSNQKCMWDESLKQMKALAQGGKDPTCPYPFSQIKDTPTTSFLENQKNFLMQWLETRFSQKGYEIEHLSFHNQLRDYFGILELSREALDNAGIALTVTSRKPPYKRHYLYFAANDINNRENEWSCFLTFVNDYRTDLLFCSLRNDRPNLFDKQSSFYIKHYDIYFDRLYLVHLGDDNYELQLSSFWNPSQKKLSYEKLKKGIEGLGLQYALLFKKPESKPIVFDDMDDGSASDPVMIINESYPSQPSFPLMTIRERGDRSYQESDHVQDEDNPDIPEGEEVFDDLP